MISAVSLVHRLPQVDRLVQSLLTFPVRLQRPTCDRGSQSMRTTAAAGPLPSPSQAVMVFHG